MRNLLAAALLCLLAPLASAAVLFSDSFESGDLSAKNEFFQWGTPTRVHVRTDVARTGTHAAMFRFDGTPNVAAGNDAFAELRFKFPTPRTELWLSYYIRLPANYYHRAPVGPANNKFLFLWSKSYRDPGNRLGLQLGLDRVWDRAAKRWITHTGNSVLSWIAYTRNTQVLPATHDAPGHRAVALMVDRETDLNTWMRVLVHWRRASGPGALDGVVEVYKTVNGRTTTVLQQRAVQTWGPDTGGDPAYNFLTDGYLLGWANSGFSERTDIAIDDVELHDSQPCNFTAP